MKKKPQATTHEEIGAQPADAPTATPHPWHHPNPTEASKAIFGCDPRNVIFPIEVACETLDWLESIFHAIRVLHENGNDSSATHIKHLAKLGAHVAADASNSVGCMHETMRDHIEAVETAERVAA